MRYLFLLFCVAILCSCENKEIPLSEYQKGYNYGMERNKEAQSKDFLEWEKGYNEARRTE